MVRGHSPASERCPSYISTWGGFIYLATVLDCAALKVVGYAMADHMHTSSVCQAIDMAVRRCPIEEGVTVFPLGQGKSVHVPEVPGPPGVLWYPPVRGAYRSVTGWVRGLQSFNATLKNERVHQIVDPTKGKSVNNIASWIEPRYNYIRLHSGLLYRTPNEVEREFLGLTKAS